MPQAATAQRVTIDSDPFLPPDGSWHSRGHWPAHWVRLPGADEPRIDDPFSGGVFGQAPRGDELLVAGYRLAFESGADETVRIHVSADERYELHLDGELIGRGPDRSDPDHWAFATFELTLPAGPHLLAARVWSLGAGAPFAQLSAGHGFLLASETRPDLDTGTADWRTAELPGCSTVPNGAAWGTGRKTAVDGREYPWGWETASDDLDWVAALPAERAHSAVFVNDMRPGHGLIPSILPAQHERLFPGGRVRLVADWSGEATASLPVRAADDIADETGRWQGLLDGTAVVIAPRTRRRVLIDLDDYVCAYPVLSVDGGRGATVRISWQEALLRPDGSKGDRDEIEGRLFRPVADAEQAAIPVGDLFTAGGGSETFSSLWWQAGRYVELQETTGDDPLTVTGLRFLESRYPYELRSTLDSDDARLADLTRLAFRTLQMCSHETTMDCPYYEQLQYAGDSRIQNLVAYLTTGDDLLARQTLLAFDRSRDTTGITKSRTPSAIRQRIPPFSLWWVAMVHDFAAWRGDLDFVRSLLPGVRSVLDAFRGGLDADGVLTPLPGWTFVDWADGWDGGVPPGAQWGPSAVGNLQLAHVADLAAQLEEWAGEPGYVTLHTELARRALDGAESAFWDAERGLYADDPGHTAWSEHAQSLAVLAGAAHGRDALTRALDGGVTQTTVYFDHYLFESLGRLGRTDVILDRMGLWFDLVDSGLRTVVEQPEPTRSDCHAWGAHPLFHLVATFLGVRPTSPGMATVTVDPQLGGLGRLSAAVPTPHGVLTVGVDGDELTVDAPEGIRVTRH